MLQKRSYDSEIIDDFSITDERIDQALNELKIINRFLGGNSTTRKGVEMLINKVRHNSAVKILDVGMGGADNLLGMENYYLDIYGIDLNRRACFFAKGKNPGLKLINGNALSSPVNNNKIDLTHFSLFLHHFKEDDIKKILKSYLAVSKYGLVINDLRRSILAFAGIKLLTTFLSKSIFVKNDGPLSVKRGFKKNELVKILTDMEIKNFVIKKEWAFRWLVVIYK